MAAQQRGVSFVAPLSPPPAACPTLPHLRETEKRRLIPGGCAHRRVGYRRKSCRADTGVAWLFVTLSRHASRAISHNHQIFSDDDLALKILRRWGAPSVVADAVEGRDQMRQHEGLDPRLLRDTADILDRGMVGLHVRHQIFKLDRPAFGDLATDVSLDRWDIHRLVYEDIGALGHFRHRFRRRGIARECYRAV